MGKNSGYTRPALFVVWGEGLDLCELENRNAKVSQDFLSMIAAMNNLGLDKTEKKLSVIFLKDAWQ